ncbi:MAG: HD domain-containing protein [candidate division NC10 bacterium]|nr:HD domain-containing protein [candidate division NC10 bacterium]
MNDIVKGGGHRPASPREVKGAPRRMSDLVRRGEKPAPPVQDSVPPEGSPSEDQASQRSSSGLGVLIRKGVEVSPALRTGSPEGPLPPPLLSAGEDRGAGTRETTDQVFQRAVSVVEGILQAVRGQVPFSIANAEKTVEALLQSLQAGDALLVPFFSGGSPSPSPAREVVNVCIIVLQIGLELGYAPEELRKLGLAAILHNVGMARLPKELLERQSPLNPKERTSLEQHPKEGARLLQGLGPRYTWLAEVILQVHERMDGSGYPNGLMGQQIHEYASIVGLADIYESLVHHRPFRRPLGPLEALKELLKRERTTFPERILKALIRALSTFPVGSLVRLNTEEIGRVVAKNKDFPLRPVVEVLVRRGKRLEEPVVIDLSQNPLLYIQDSVVQEDLP